MATTDPAAREAFVADCLRRIAQGDGGVQAAVSALYRSFRAPMLAYLRGHGLDAQAAEDVLHDVFIKVAQRAGQCELNGASTAWLWAVVRNARHDHFRQLGPLDTADVDDLAETLPAAGIEHVGSALERCVGEAFQRFAKDHPERADALRLMHLERWSIAQVAVYLGRTANATKEFLSQCRKVFKPYVEPCHPFLNPG